MELKKMPIKIFTRKLTNVAGLSDEELFKNLVAQDPQKLNEFKLYEKIWEEAGKVGIFSQIDTPSDWAAIRSRVHIPIEANYKRILLPRYLLRVAAILLLAIGLSAGFYKLITSYSKTASDFTRVLADKNLKEIKLPDGTIVSLNVGSSLTYRNKFGEKIREVILEGEGLFDVVKNPDVPFKVYTGVSVITVTGTSFAIREEKGGVKVSVLSGTVQLSNKDDQSNILSISANQSGYLLATRELKLEDNIEINELSWKTGHLVFDETPLDSALFDIARHFHKELTLGTGISEDITAEFQDQPLSEILDELKQVAGLEFDTTGTALIVRK